MFADWTSRITIYLLFAISLADRNSIKFVAKSTLCMINYLWCIKTHSRSHLPSTIVFNHRNHFMRKLIFSLLIIFSLQWGWGVDWNWTVIARPERWNNPDASVEMKCDRETSRHCAAPISLFPPFWSPKNPLGLWSVQGQRSGLWGEAECQWHSAQDVDNLVASIATVLKRVRWWVAVTLRCTLPFSWCCHWN